MNLRDSCTVLLAAALTTIPALAAADPPPRADMVVALSGFERGPDLGTIRNWGPAGARTLMDIADDARAMAHTRLRALYALRAFPGETIVRDYLRATANDATRPLLFRRAAFDALAEGFSDVETLARWLHDPAVDVRDGAAWALSHIHLPAARTVLEDALNAERDETVRITLRTALQAH